MAYDMLIILMENSAYTTNRTLLKNDSYCSENTRPIIAKNLFWNKKEQL